METQRQLLGDGTTQQLLEGTGTTSQPKHFRLNRTKHQPTTPNDDGDRKLVSGMEKSPPNPPQTNSVVVSPGAQRVAGIGREQHVDDDDDDDDDAHDDEQPSSPPEATKKVKNPDTDEFVNEDISPPPPIFQQQHYHMVNPGIERVTGNRSRRPDDLSRELRDVEGSSSWMTRMDRENESAVSLVEARLVVQPVFHRAEAVDVMRRRKRLTCLALSVIVIGVAVGFGVGRLANSDNGGDFLIIDNEIKPIDFKVVNFDNYSQSASQCFRSINELYSTVDSYVKLKATIAGEDFDTDMHNASLAARDEIASVYGWPIGRFCVSDVTTLRGVFSPTFRDEPAFGLFNEDISTWDVSKVRNLDQLFSGNGAFNNSLQKWNVSRVTSMARCFHESTFFNQGISMWDTSRVTSMEDTFFGATLFDQPIGVWDTSNVLNMACMFCDARSFNHALGDWNVTSVLTMSHMFDGASSFNQDLSQWSLSRVIDMFDVFREAASFNQTSTCEWGGSLYRFGPKSYTELVRLEGAFHGTACENTEDPFFVEWPLTSLCGNCESYFKDKLRNPTEGEAHQGSGLAFSSTEALQQAVDQYMLLHLGKLRSDEAPAVRAGLSQYGWPIGNWNVSLVDDFSHVFSSARFPWMAVFNEDISKWDVSNGMSFAWMFAGAALFDQRLLDWNISEAQDLTGMFGDPSEDFSLYAGHLHQGSGASSFDQEISLWDVAKVTSMEAMFRFAVSFNGDISSWDVSRVTSMKDTFRNAHAFNQDLGLWNTSKVTTMEAMFRETQFFRGYLPWDVSGVRSFNTMFAESNFDGDLSSWDTSNGKDFVGMFFAVSLTHHDLSGWNVTSATNMNDMFAYSTFDGDITKWEPLRCTSFTHMFFNSSFNQNLCRWGSFLGQPGRQKVFMFARSKCADTGDPDVTQDPVSPLCVVCTE